MKFKSIILYIFYFFICIVKCNNNTNNTDNNINIVTLIVNSESNEIYKNYKCGSLIEPPCMSLYDASQKAISSRNYYLDNQIIIYMMPGLYKPIEPLIFIGYSSVIIQKKLNDTDPNCDGDIIIDGNLMSTTWSFNDTIIITNTSPKPTPIPTPSSPFNNMSSCFIVANDLINGDYLMKSLQISIQLIGLTFSNWKSDIIGLNNQQVNYYRYFYLDKLIFDNTSIVIDSVYYPLDFNLVSSIFINLNTSTCWNDPKHSSIINTKNSTVNLYNVSISDSTLCNDKPFLLLEDSSLKLAIIKVQNNKMGSFLISSSPETTNVEYESWDLEFINNNIALNNSFIYSGFISLVEFPQLVNQLPPPKPNNIYGLKFKNNIVTLNSSSPTKGGSHYTKNIGIIYMYLVTFDNIIDIEIDSLKDSLGDGILFAFNFFQSEISKIVNSSIKSRFPIMGKNSTITIENTYFSSHTHFNQCENCKIIDDYYPTVKPTKTPIPSKVPNQDSGSFNQAEDQRIYWLKLSALLIIILLVICSICIISFLSVYHLARINKKVVNIFDGYDANAPINNGSYDDEIELLLDERASCDNDDVQSTPNIVYLSDMGSNSFNDFIQLNQLNQLNYNTTTIKHV